jgi:3D (Asp-Asp-Asp) domain-containing protein
MTVALVLVGVWHLAGVKGVQQGKAMSAGARACISEEMLPVPTEPVEFQATAYCESGITKSGVPAAPGLAAADLSILPLGSLVQVEGARHRGVYRIMDTGRLVKGRIIDIYISNLQQAIQFGRQRVHVSVLQYGRRGAQKQASLAD